MLKVTFLFPETQIATEILGMQLQPKLKNFCKSKNTKCKKEHLFLYIHAHKSLFNAQTQA